MFIEFVRGVPFITILFMANTMLPLFVPESWTPDRLLRPLVGIALFSAAYMAEEVRGGLQLLGRGQYEGAMALGLNYPLMMALVVLPQALTMVIPGIVNNFVGLFMDTTLVSIVGVTDFLEAMNNAFKDPAWSGPTIMATGYVFAGMFYFVVCYGMTRYSALCRAQARQGTQKMTRPKAAADETRGDAAIDFVGVHKWYGDFHALRNINLTVRRGERIVVCGPSGSGKSTLIRCVNRLEEHQRGSIVVDGVELTPDVKRIDEVRREVGMVFQSFNLFPHLTILENCTLAPIWVRKMPKRDAEDLAMTLLDPGQDPRAGVQVSGSAVRRPAAAGRDRARALHESEDHAVRRADLGARSRDGERGAGHDDRRSRRTA